MNFETALEDARVAVQQAAQVCSNIQRSIPGQALTKNDRSPVTAADLAAQVIVLAQLEQSSLRCPVVAEESAEILSGPDAAQWRVRVTELVNQVCPQLTESDVLKILDRGQHNGGKNGRFWVLDPIDGTKGFLRGEQYAVALGLVVEGELKLGVLGCPNLRHGDAVGRVYSALHGQGSWCSGLDLRHRQPVQVNDFGLERANFCESVEAAHSAHDASARIAELLRISAPPVRIDSQCKYAMVADGSASIYLRLPTRKNYIEKIWDHAAGALVVSEAGGQVTDIRGRPLDFGVGRGLECNEGVIVTNGRVHEQTLNAIEQVLEL